MLCGFGNVVGAMPSAGVRLLLVLLLLLLQVIVTISLQEDWKSTSFLTLLILLRQLFKSEKLVMLDILQGVRNIIF